MALAPGPERRGVPVLLTTDQIGAFVIIFEDVRVSALGPATPLRVLAMPLFVDGMDGSPCTILAEVAS